MLLALVLGAVMLLPAAFHLERYVITGGSMAGTFDRGSVVFERTVPVADLQVGDVITYAPPDAAGVSGLVTHRIVRIARDRRGRPVFRTKGDANAHPDPWQFRLDSPLQGTVVFSVPYVGYVVAALSIRAVRVLALGLPALAIAVLVLVGMWRQAGAEAAASGDGREPAAEG